MSGVLRQIGITDSAAIAIRRQCRRRQELAVVANHAGMFAICREQQGNRLSTDFALEIAARLKRKVKPWQHLTHMDAAGAAALFAKPSNRSFRRIESDLRMRNAQHVQQHKKLARPFQVSEHARAIADQRQVTAGDFEQFRYGFKSTAVDQADRIGNIQLLQRAREICRVKPAMGIIDANGLLSADSSVCICKYIQRQYLIASSNSGLDIWPRANRYDDDFFGYLMLLRAISNAEMKSR